MGYYFESELLSAWAGRGKNRNLTSNQLERVLWINVEFICQIPYQQKHKSPPQRLTSDWSVRV